MRDLNLNLDAKEIGSKMSDFVAELFPICRSITGDGIRETFHRIGKRIPLDVHEVPSGTRVFDWTVPKEWNIRQAYINDPSGRRVVDFRDHNLHVVGYSTPIQARMSLSQLKEHVHTLPERPKLVPYRTSYYAEGWGFCMEEERLNQLQEGEYEVRIDSSLEPGSLTYAECYLAGDTDDEILISCHCCHPSMANDNLSGIALATQLADQLRGLRLRYSYRFLFIPGTIGSITWLARNEERVKHIKAGLVATCVGDPGYPTYKRSRQGNAPIDRAAAHVLKHSGQPHRIVDFSPYGYDERQYCSPGFDLAVGSLSRTPHNEYPEYHTSADDLGLVRPECLADSFGLYLNVLDVHGERREVPEPLSRRASHSLGDGGSTRRSVRRESVRNSWLVCGCSICRTVNTACSMWRIVRDFPSAKSKKRLGFFPRAAFSPGRRTAARPSCQAVLPALSSSPTSTTSKSRSASGSTRLIAPRYRSRRVDSTPSPRSSTVSIREIGVSSEIVPAIAASSLVRSSVRSRGRRSKASPSRWQIRSTTSMVMLSSAPSYGGGVTTTPSRSATTQEPVASATRPASFKRIASSKPRSDASMRAWRATT